MQSKRYRSFDRKERFGFHTGGAGEGATNRSSERPIFGAAEKQIFGHNDFCIGAPNDKRINTEKEVAALLCVHLQVAYKIRHAFLPLGRIECNSMCPFFFFKFAALYDVEILGRTAFASDAMIYIVGCSRWFRRERNI